MKSWSCFNRSSLAAALVAAALAPTPIVAQTFVSPGIGAWTTPPPRRSTTTPAPPGFLSSILSALDTDVPLYRAGPLGLRPHLEYQAVQSYDIDIGNLRTVDTATQTVAPGLLVEAGMHWQADYTGAWTYYSARDFKDSFDQTARLWGEYEFRAWKFGVSGEYASTYPIMVEFARQTHDTSYAADGHATYYLTDRLELELSGAYRDRTAHPLQLNPDWLSPDTQNWDTTDMLQWKYSERLKIGAGGSLGYSDASIGASMSYVRPLIRVVWMPTEALIADIDAGYERHRFRHSDARPLNNPFYKATITYIPYRTTMLIVSLTRGVTASQLADLVTDVSGWQVTLQQRLLQRLYFTGTYSQQNTDYREARSNLPVSRGDRYDTTELRVGMPLWARGSISVFFRRMDNVSSHKFYSFDTRQYGVAVDFRF